MFLCNQALFTVFDGHGKEGDLCAVFCKETLPGVLSTDLRESRTVEEGLKRAFNRTNVQVGFSLVSDCGAYRCDRSLVSTGV